jgi:hypothetical protein
VTNAKSDDEQVELQAKPNEPELENTPETSELPSNSIPFPPSNPLLSETSQQKPPHRPEIDLLLIL